MFHYYKRVKLALNIHWKIVPPHSARKKKSKLLLPHNKAVLENFKINKKKKQ